MSTIILLLSTFLTFWMGSLLAVKTVGKNDIPWANFVLFAIGATGITAHFFGLY